MSSRNGRLVRASWAVSLMLIILGVTPGVADDHITARFIPDLPAPGAATLSMQPGNSTGPTFDVEIRVTGIDDVFGVAFQVEFDPALATFVGSDGTGSFLADGGAATSFQAQESAPGILVCGATRLGQIPGVDVPGPPGSALLVTLSFSAVAPTAGTNFDFGPSATRAVLACPTAGDPCSQLPDGGLTWAGGTVITEVAVPASSPWALAFLVAAFLGLSGLACRTRAAARERYGA